MVTCGAPVPHLKKSIRADLPLDREIKMFRIRKAVGMPKSDFGISIQGFERCEVKGGVWMLPAGIGWNDKRKDLPVAAVDAIKEWSVKEFLAAWRPEQAERDVANFLELAEVFERRVENARAGADAVFAWPAG